LALTSRQQKLTTVITDTGQLTGLAGRQAISAVVSPGVEMTGNAQPDGVTATHWVGQNKAY